MRRHWTPEEKTYVKECLLVGDNLNTIKDGLMEKFGKTVTINQLQSLRSYLNLGPRQLAKELRAVSFSYSHAEDMKLIELSQTGIKDADIVKKLNSIYGNNRSASSISSRRIKLGLKKDDIVGTAETRCHVHLTFDGGELTKNINSQTAMTIAKLILGV